jgi:hypothetical protein
LFIESLRGSAGAVEREKRERERERERKLWLWLWKKKLWKKKLWPWKLCGRRSSGYGRKEGRKEGRNPRPRAHTHEKLLPIRDDELGSICDLFWYMSDRSIPS